MIPAAFGYDRPTDLSTAVRMIEDHGEGARVLAGGHSLIPMMKLRMAALTHLVDLQDIPELRGVRVVDGRVTIGAMTTQAELIENDALAAAAPILREAALQIADPQVRYVGTIGGNVANGDPANDMPGLMQCLGAAFTLFGPDGEREVAARDFYEGAFQTARDDAEILTRVAFDATRGGSAYEKQKRKIGDYATAAAAVIVRREGMSVVEAAIAMTNLSDTPVFARAAAEALVGTDCGAAARVAAVAAMQPAIDPNEDNRGPVAFKRHVAGVILDRAIQRAWSRA